MKDTKLKMLQMLDNFILSVLTNFLLKFVNNGCQKQKQPQFQQINHYWQVFNIFKKSTNKMKKIKSEEVRTICTANTDLLNFMVYIELLLDWNYQKTRLSNEIQIRTSTQINYEKLRRYFFYVTHGSTQMEVPKRTIDWRFQLRLHEFKEFKINQLDTQNLPLILN